MDRRPGLDLDVKQSSDVNVTVRSRSSNRMEQETVESGKEDIGFLMQRIGSNLLHVSPECDHSNKKRQQQWSVHWINCMWYRIIIAI